MTARIPKYDSNNDRNVTKTNHSQKWYKKMTKNSTKKYRK